jgi:hypothetical protein
MSIKSSSAITSELTAWQTGTLNTIIKNAPPVITPANENAVFTGLQVIVQDINDSAYNKADGIQITDVTGLTTALANKQPADSTILNAASIIDNLTTGASNRPLSANQGLVLSNLIAAIPAPNTASYLAFGSANQVSASTIVNHIADTSIHFHVNQIDHTQIQNIGINSHSQIDTHIANNAIHFTQSQIDHTQILNRGSNTHAQIDTHISNLSNPHVVTLTQASTAEGITEAKGTIPVSNGSQYLGVALGTTGQVLTVDTTQTAGVKWATPASNFVTNGASVGTAVTTFGGNNSNVLQFKGIKSLSAAITVAADSNLTDINLAFVPGNVDHQTLTNVGTNTHAQIDTHIANSSIHVPQNDSITSTNNLWSASKTQTVINAVQSTIPTVSTNLYNLDSRTQANYVTAGSTTSYTRIIPNSPTTYQTGFVATNSSPYGFASADHFNTFATVLLSLQNQVNLLSTTLGNKYTNVYP